MSKNSLFQVKRFQVILVCVKRIEFLKAKRNRLVNDERNKLLKERTFWKKLPVYTMETATKQAEKNLRSHDHNWQLQFLDNQISEWNKMKQAAQVTDSDHVLLSDDDASAVYKFTDAKLIEDMKKAELKYRERQLKTPQV